MEKIGEPDEGLRFDKKMRKKGAKGFKRQAKYVVSVTETVTVEGSANDLSS